METMFLAALAAMFVLSVIDYWLDLGFWRSAVALAASGLAVWALDPVPLATLAILSMGASSVAFCITLVTQRLSIVPGQRLMRGRP